MLARFLTATARLLLRLRYRVRIRGVEAVARGGRRGLLLLPNHPALIDPVILLCWLWPTFRPRALADRDQIDRFFIRWGARKLGVIPLPDLARHRQGSVEQVRAALRTLADALRNGENVLMYPSGRAYHQRCEDLAGNSGVEQLLRDVPDARVVLVRTRGLWGSSFSRGTGREPDVTAALKRGLRGLLVSGIFFAPRRDVSIELVEPDDIPRNAPRGRLNRYLEAFYNADAPPNTYVPYSRWEPGPARAIPEPRRGARAGNPADVPAATREIVRNRLAELTGVENPPDQAALGRDLGMDSLSKADLLAWLGEEFGFAQADVDTLRTVGDVYLAADGRGIGTGPKLLAPIPARWFTQPPPPGPVEGLREMTVAEALIAQARRRPGQIAIADQRSGALSYRRLVTAATVLSGSIAALPGERVGILLPASVGATVTYFAALLAGKTPVMLNWTAGPGNLAYATDLTGIEAVLSARALTDRLAGQGVSLGAAIEDRLVLLEDIRGRIGLRAKLTGAVRARWRLGSLQRQAARAPRDAAVLFTSGSEARPKGVPLTNANMLANVADGWECFRFRAGDRVLGILPPFHSFGLTVSTVLPLSLGLQVVFHPDPTEAKALGAIIEAYQVTTLMVTPTFLAGILRSAQPGQLDTLRLVVTGAERCPPDVYGMLEELCPGAVVLEGYGVTECAPVVSVNREADPRPETIGKPLTSVEIARVDPDTHEPAAPDRPGMLLVRGPNVFAGYLGGAGDPFVEHAGKRWYRTGDLVTEGPDGTLTFAGRLKRFVKLGGEMVSLPAIEAAIAPHLASPEDEGPSFAVAAGRDEDRPEITLFTKREITREQVNAWIRAAGLSGLHNIRRVIGVDELPLLGTGKIDYRALADRLDREQG